jgi:hypothetical protein
MNFSDIFGGKVVSDENPKPGKIRLSTMMNNFFHHEATESDAERALEGNERRYNESWLDVLGSTRAEEHLARREAQQEMIEGFSSDKTEVAKEKLKSLIEGWSYQPPQPASEQGEMDEMGITPDVVAGNEELEKVIRSSDPVKILSMVLRMLAEDKD